MLDGVIVKSELIGRNVLFIAVNGEIFPVPVIVEPIIGFEFTHEYTVPKTVPKTVTLAVVELAQTT